MTGKKNEGVAGGGGGGEKKIKKRKNAPTDDSSLTKMKKVDGNFVSVNKTDAEDTVHLPGFNLAGRPESLKNKDGGVKRNEMKTVGPYHTGNVNTESYWHFVVRSNKNEWIRFNPDSISVLVYGTHDNPRHAAGSADPKLAAAKVALQAGIGSPLMFWIPRLWELALSIASTSQSTTFPSRQTRPLAVFFYTTFDVRESTIIRQKIFLPPTKMFQLRLESPIWLARLCLPA